MPLNLRPAIDLLDRLNDCLLFHRYLWLRRDCLLRHLGGLILLRLWRVCARVRYIMPKSRSQLLPIVCEELRVVCPTRDSDVSHSVVEQVFRTKFRVHVDEHSVGCLSLAGVAGHGVAVVKMRVLHGVKLNLTASIHLDGHAAFVNAFHCAKFTVR